MAKGRPSGQVIRETLGFLGVIASLIFVGFEIRQNTVALEATAIQASVAVAREQIQLFVVHPELARINSVAASDPSQLTPSERDRYRWVLRSFWWGMQGLYRQWYLGVLPQAEWESFRAVMCAPGGTTSVFPSFWEEETQFMPEFVAIVRECDS